MGRGPLFEYMPASDMQAQTAFDELIQSIETSTQTKHSTLSLRDLLIDANDPQQERLNKSIYLLTNSVGATDNFFGADAAASWWHRNFRMYAKIQHAASPGERVLVIGGQGHIAILRDLLHFDLRREAVPVLPHL